MKPLSEMTTAELVDYWIGHLLIDIGRGEFRFGVSLLIQTTMKDAFDRGVEEGKISGGGK